MSCILVSFLHTVHIEQSLYQNSCALCDRQNVLSGEMQAVAAFRRDGMKKPPPARREHRKRDAALKLAPV